MQFIRLLDHLSLNPLAGQPPVQHVEGSLGLVVWHHVATGVESHEGEVARRLDGTDLAAVRLELQVLERGLDVGLLARPFELLGPGEVSEPVANLVETDSQQII